MTRKAKISHDLSIGRLRLLQKLISSLGMMGSFVLAQVPASATKELSIPEPSAPTETAPSISVSPVAPSPVAPSPVAPSPVAPAIVAPPELLSPVPSIIPADATAPIPTVRSTPSDRDDGPAAVVLSERSTGCQAAVEFGQGLRYGPCGEPKPVAASVQPAAPSVAAVQMGDLSVGYDGIGLGSTPTSRDYYQRTVRPVGRLGNGNIRLIFPLSIPAPISSWFGWRVHPITGDRRFHSGTDLAAPQGTPVVAAFAGQVAIADFMGGYGLAIALNHNQATQQTLYAHLSEIFVKPGESVKQGDVIGRVGSTGNSTGPHLHFEFRELTSEGWVAIDAGTHLEYSLAQLVKALEQTAQNPVPLG